MNLSTFRPRAFSSSLLLLLASIAADAQVVTAIGQNFTGSTYGADSQSLPPDANGAIGPDYFMEFINGEAAFYNKTNVSTPIRITDVSFWSQAGVNIASDATVTDPRVIYDSASRRWFASQVDASTTAADPTHLANNFLFGFSDSADPSGSWHGFIFRADPTTGRFADFPTLGVDANGVYLSGDMLHDSTNVGCGLVSIPKAILLGTTNISSRTWFGVMSYASRGQVLQAAICFDGSSSGNILSLGDIGSTSDPYSNIVTFAVQNATGYPATLTASTSLIVSPYVVPDNFDMGYPLFNPVQPDGTTTLQANDARFSAKVYAVGGVLYAVHNTEVNGRVAIRWYRLNAATQTLLESGTITDPNLDLFFPSIAANPAGVVVIGCNGSSFSTFISCYAYVGATVQGVTTFGSPLLLQSGVASYHDENELISLDLLGTIVDSRWGDYSSMSVDPNDPNRFWTMQLYPSGVDSSSGYDVGIWSTQITEILTALPALSLTMSNANAVVSWPGTAIPFNLESSTNLAAGGWTLVTPNFSTNHGLVSYQTGLTNRARFFRLHQP